jgi:hypothetical protein
MPIQSIQDLVDRVVTIYQSMEGRRIGHGVRQRNPVISALPTYTERPKELLEHLGSELSKLKPGSKSKFLLELLQVIVLFLQPDSTMSPEALIETLGRLSTQQNILPEENVPNPQAEGLAARVWSAVSWVGAAAASTTEDKEFSNDCRRLLLEVIDYLGEQKSVFKGLTATAALQQALSDQENSARLSAFQRQFDLLAVRDTLQRGRALLFPETLSPAVPEVPAVDLSESVLVDQSGVFFESLTREQALEAEVSRLEAENARLMRASVSDTEPDARLVGLQRELEALRAEREEALSKINGDSAAREALARELEQRLGQANQQLAALNLEMDRAVKAAEEKFRQELELVKAGLASPRPEQESASAAPAFEPMAASVSDTNVDDAQEELRKLKEMVAFLKTENQRLQSQVSRTGRDFERVQADLVEANQTLQTFYSLTPNEANLINQRGIEKLIELRLSDRAFADRFQQLMEMAARIDWDDIAFSNLKAVYNQLMMQREDFSRIYAPIFEKDAKLSAKELGRMRAIVSESSGLASFLNRTMTDCRTRQVVSMSIAGKPKTQGDEIYLQKAAFVKLCADCAEALSMRLENLAGRGVVESLLGAQKSYPEFIDTFAPFCQRNKLVIEAAVDKKHQKSPAVSVPSRRVRDSIAAGARHRQFPPAPSPPHSDDEEDSNVSDENWSTSDEEEGEDNDQAACAASRSPSPSSTS